MAEGPNTLNVVDLGLGMAGALAAQLYANLGADVIRYEPAAGDPFYDVYPAYPIWHTAATLKTDLAGLDADLANADIAILGGESWPDLDWSFDADELARRFPKLIVLEINGYATADAATRPTVDLLVQARTGFVNLEYSQRPMAYAMPLPSYGAALTGVLGAQAARVERARTGKGQVVRSSMQQATAVWCSGVWTQAERPDAPFAVGTPPDTRQPVFRCANDEYLILMFGTPGSLHTVYKTLDIDIEVDPNDRNFPDVRRGPTGYFCDRTVIEPAIAHRDRTEVLDALWKGGVAADAVLPAGTTWSDTQAVHNGIIQTHDTGWRSVGNPIRIDEVPGAGATTNPAPRHMPSFGGPLEGIRVVDMGAFVAGPYASKLLADLGADVIKVEGPGGDPFRFMYKNAASVTRGKRSLAVDIKKPEGMAILRELVATADAFAHNMRVGVAERNGFDPQSLRAVNPDLVTIHSSAYGKDGPKAMNSGWDPVLQPYCGHSIRAGGEGNDPQVYSLPLLDYATGSLGAIAILEGILRRDATGHAVDLGVNLLDSGIYMLSELVQRPDGAFTGAPVIDKDQTGFHPAERLYQAADGWIAVAARSEGMALALATELGLTLPQRAEWGAAEAELIAARIKARPVAELLSALDHSGVWAERCASGWGEFLASEDARAIGFVAERDDEHYGHLSATGRLVLLGNHPPEPRLHKLPAVGEHNREIVAGLGHSEAEIADLYERKVLV